MKTMLTVMGGYYVVTGLWPLLSIVTFQMFTGVKKDTWLVKMVGLLALSIGITLLYSGLLVVTLHPEVIVLCLLSSLSFFLVDIIYAMNKTIPKIYLADALVELLFFIYFLVMWFQ
ncbi:MAG: hypothetical protein ACJ76H_11920 [Bacteriovoracaceae bacterium]